jgi:DNA-binding LacI/PurR family transcriptional regulator
VNIKKVAELAGVSISTVSRVINNTAYVSPEIKARIEQVVADTGYRPNSLAKELLRQKTDTIGVMLPRIDLGTFAAIFDGITAVLKQHGYNILLANTHDQESEELRYLKLFHEKRVDGVLYFATAINDNHVKALSKLHMPVVVVGQSGASLSCPAVRLDNFGAARAMVGHLIGLGHQRIACLAVPDHDINIGTLRKEGYFAALREQGIAADPDLVVVGDFEYPSGAEGARKLMRGPRLPPTAIYCITDRLAVAAAGWLQANGYAVPGEVSVACIDDPALLSYLHPSISTMGFDYLETGTRAGRMIIDCIAGIKPEPAELVMPYTLRERGSTAAPRA